MTKTHRPCVAMIVSRPDGAVLLVHKPRNKDDWQIPQGGIEKGETAQQAAARELQEETGLSIDPASFTQLPQTYQYDFPEEFMQRQRPRYSGQHLTFLQAKAPQDQRVTVDQRELDEHVWVQPQEIAQYIPRKEYLTALHDILL